LQEYPWMRCNKGNKGTETTVRKTARQAAAPVVPPTHPVAALIPVLLAALTAASTAPPSATFDINVWAQAVVDALLHRLTSRTPLDGQKCPFSGLNRAQIYELRKLGPSGEPEIESFTLAEDDEASGARFFFVGSALAYLRRQAAKKRTTKKTSKTRKNGQHS